MTSGKEYSPAAADLADLNMIESIREHARWQTPCECIEENGVLLFAGANEFPVGYRNCVARVDPRVSARATLGRAREFFAARRRGFSMLVFAKRDADLETELQAAGLVRRADIPAMLTQTPLREIEIPPDIRIERFTEERHVRDATEIVAEAYQQNRLPAEQTRVYFTLPAQLLSDRVIGYVAYRGARPLATALTIMSGKGAGVYWVGTVPAAGRGGLGTLCTQRATNAGFARGASVVALQASPFGEPIYQRLGYQTYDRMRWYSQPAPT